MHAQLSPPPPPPHVHTSGAPARHPLLPPKADGEADAGRLDVVPELGGHVQPVSVGGGGGGSEGGAR